MISVKFL